MESVGMKTVMDCREHPLAEINNRIRRESGDSGHTVMLENPGARHNLGVCVTEPLNLIINGDAGYYAASLCDHIHAEIKGDAGWAVGENLMNGEIVVEGNTASACGASMHNGTIVVKKSAGARAAIGLKGGELIIGGNAGYMTGFMMQKGTVIICGDAGRAVGDSMYTGEIYVGGDIEEAGSGTKVEEVTEEEYEALKSRLQSYEMSVPPSFRKLVSDGSLHNFDK